MIFVHHPLSTIAGFYLAIVGVVVQLDAGVILVALIPVLSVFLTYWLANRTRKAIQRETAEASAAAAAVQAEVKGKVEEVHVLVNSQAEVLRETLRVTKEDFARELANRDARIGVLENTIRLTPGLTPPREGAP